MEDNRIIALYWARNEEAIRQTDRTYGAGLRTLAERILRSRQDAEECVSDTYWKAWDTMPPQRPAHLFGYLAKICRHISLDRLDWSHAAKRRAEVVTLTEELALCIPDDRREQEMEAKELAALLNAFLETLPQENRMLFLRRYWYGDTAAQIAGVTGLSENAVQTRLHRVRGKLRKYLEEEGIRV